MHSPHRLDRHDWRAGLVAGMGLGLLFLGVGARAGMRLIALSSGQAPALTIEGSIAVSLLGTLTGALVATVFLLARTTFPARQWARAALFWTVIGAVVLRGLHRSRR